ncbi:hypothetical protein CF70_015290 [Cupriavidus sp. SK-3]|uniref:SRPBCC family protein n=1 Tax=Cupriavidus sp. SK-3 TaxID=1470558 RepID=UPI0004511517|nr:SRPBCC family protein [Cupriavidus sp. SK-3]KDP85221.1 hypothetical protein CF70_015290 [Cupriavidus sp. SK-3]
MLKASKFVVRQGLPRLAVAVMSMMALEATSPAFSQTDNDQRSSIMTMKDDLANRSPDIHWPAGFDPRKADLFSHNELFISATCERVWQHIVEAPKWPQWYPNSKEVHIISDPGSVLKEESTFRWTTFGLPIESRINEFVPFSRIGWFGYAPGTKPAFYHTWYLTPRGNGCQVVTDEVGNGPDAANLRKNDEGLMHRGHDLWLATLRWVAENKLD